MSLGQNCGILKEVKEVRDMENIPENNEEVKNPERKHPVRKLGVLADRFHWIADDFDDPLPEFEEYMGTPDEET